MTPSKLLDGVLLLQKSAGPSSAQVLTELKKKLNSIGYDRKNLPAIGHAGTLDPFASGLLVALLGKATKLSQYFLESRKSYIGTVLLGSTNVALDSSLPVESTAVVPDSLTPNLLQTVADQMSSTPYLQTPPMYSAKKLDGQPLYKLARKGLEVEREAIPKSLYQFKILELTPPRVRIFVECSSGTYIRVLAQDFATQLGTVALLESLERTASGGFDGTKAIATGMISHATFDGSPAWIPFDQLLMDWPNINANKSETLALTQGRQSVLDSLVLQIPHSCAQATIRAEGRLLAIIKKTNHVWKTDRVFPSNVL